ncbi:hypothetical protein [Paenibacillus sp. FSL R7-0331]|uniref:hypothetical protein n=1 Tax=Paenibacillus sp. FSL R7-0331 TaxID=1536773 RepID=UPI0004F744A3|nr:hypothetical protein [Paenibacillus sp. FSL R7-0331]AIQ55434.1 hypothetical protein R70331_30790 [Paenibacillus sp. FSL R7-0331]
MDLKEILIIAVSLILFVVAGAIINKAGDNDHLRLLTWCLRMTTTLLIISLPISLYGDYHIDKAFDFYAFGVHDSKGFFRSYFLVILNLFFLLLHILMTRLVQWRGVTNFSTEQKLNMHITTSLAVLPLLHVWGLGYPLGFW